MTQEETRLLTRIAVISHSSQRVISAAAHSLPETAITGNPTGMLEDALKKLQINVNEWLTSFKKA